MVALVAVEVEKVSLRKNVKTVYLSNGEVIDCPKMRRLEPGERLLVEGKRLTKKVENGTVLINPSFESRVDVKIGSQSLPVTFTEPMTESDWSLVGRLRRYHYRDRLPFGPQAVLIARITPSNSDDPQNASVGFIEAGFAPLCNSARDRVLDAEFRDGKIKWHKWRHEERGVYGHLVLGISRVVVQPYLRGIGLGAELLRQCTRLISKHWESRGAKPLFLEIVADMLRYNSFPRIAGFVYAGSTSGNLKRVAKDTKYYLKKLESREVDFDRPGVERMQERRAVLLRRRVHSRRLPLQDVLSLLKNLEPSRFYDNYGIFHDIVRLPKPTWMRGLTRQAQIFLQRRKREMAAPRNGKSVQMPGTPGRIRFENVSVSRRVPLRGGRRAVEAAAAFGIPPHGTTIPILSNVSFEIATGEICLIEGPSGCGKTTILRLLSRERIFHTGHVAFPEHYQPGIPAPASKRRVVVSSIQGGLEDALRGLAMAGLSDARLYLQPVETLSQGQKERLRLAQLACSPATTWLIDDFAALLDDWTARVVSKRLRRMVKSAGNTLIVASPRSSTIFDVLRPDVILTIRPDGTAMGLREQDRDEFMPNLGEQVEPIQTYSYSSSSDLAKLASILSLS